MSDGVCLRGEKFIGVFKCSVRKNSIIFLRPHNRHCTQARPKITRCFFFFNSTLQPISLDGQSIDSDGCRKLWTRGEVRGVAQTNEVFLFSLATVDIAKAEDPASFRPLPIGVFHEFVNAPPHLVMQACQFCGISNCTPPSVPLFQLCTPSGRPQPSLGLRANPGGEP